MDPRPQQSVPNLKSLTNQAVQGKFDAQPIDTKRLFGEIQNFPRLKESFLNNALIEALKKCAYLANESSRHIVEQGNDVFDKKTLQRNTKLLKELGKTAGDMVNEYNMLGQRALALMDEMGIMLDRYYGLTDDSAQQTQPSQPPISREVKA
jgi:hypothetical protein